MNAKKFQEFFAKQVTKRQNKIIGVGRNYFREDSHPMIQDIPEPFFFFKPWSSLLP